MTRWTLLLVLLSVFGWMGLSDYVRAEFLKGRNLEYVKAARALGVGNVTIMYRHLLPNGMTPVITFLPFRMSGAILALTSLISSAWASPHPHPASENCWRRVKTTLRPGGSLSLPSPCLWVP